MWRLSYALHGLTSPENSMAPAGAPTRLTARPSCRHASFIFNEHNSSIDSSHSRDACLLSASTLPDGRLLALQINGERAELRDAKPFAPVAPLLRANEDGIQLSLHSASGSSSGTCRSEAVDVDSGEDARLVPLSTSSWRLLHSTVLVSDDDNEPLQRIRRHSDFEPAASVLASDALYQLQLEPLEKTCSVFFDSTAVNATALDSWGPHAVVVGFSSGDVSLFDWRDPSAGPLMRTSTPQPPSRSRPVRGRRGASVVHAGVMSCCALEDSFRVVCGLGNHMGTVVVTDLRKALTSSAEPRKRGRVLLADEARQAVVAGSFCTPTSYPACDMRHCRWDFGTIGMVDTGGTAMLTNIGALEAGSLRARRGWNRTAEEVSQLPATATEYGINNNSNGNAVLHTRGLRCDVSQEGCFLLSSRTTPWSASLTQRSGRRTELALSLAASEKSDGNSFTSVSCMGSIVFAQTGMGNALCATVPAC
ncbi:hypothetical protein DQ04_04621040 [Trypanosoma grayi]|uniref:hypothetical protein n=1 Tax=Trypanosoma grayi TaxID=71804 RepID=UPI0004F43CB9|nr:hypothetical protein DQ04_04621040 [Trypanosoma grayi]KEG09799.1 hypothetical protein DQ04_04621040 [Trypanosoma grayi]